VLAVPIVFFTVLSSFHGMVPTIYIRFEKISRPVKYF